MITAVDSNVLIDVFEPDPVFGPASTRQLQRCISEGGLIACGVVWAEVVALAPSRQTFHEAMGSLGVLFDPLDERSAVDAGVACGAYRRARGPKDRLIADFVIGAHATVRADRLLTRDRGFYRRYFQDLPVIDPTR